MKKIGIAFPLLLIVLLAIGKVLKVTELVKDSKNSRTVINCSPPLLSFTNVPIFTPPSPNSIRSRVNANLIIGTSQTIKTFRRGIEIMQSLPSSDKRNWTNITSIHGSLSSLPGTLWNSAKAAHATQFFLAWHRMYLYFFERIIMKLTNDNSFRIPYWNPLSNINLPSYITATTYYKTPNTVINPLNNITRLRPGITSTQLSSYTSAYHATFNNNNTYCIFLEKLETQVHGFIHSAIGGNGDFGNLNISPNDPVFLLHHANIDRLWEKWIKKGNSYPTTGSFLTQFFYFIDENGNMIKINGRQIIATANSLGYKYDDVGTTTPVNKTQTDCCPVSANRIALAQQPSSYTIKSNTTPFSFANASILNPATILQLLKNSSNQRHIYLEFEDVTISTLPNSPIEIYLVKKNDLNATPKMASFIGILDVISASFSHNNNPITRTIRVDATNVISALINSVADIKNTGIIFVANDGTNNKKLSGDVSFSNIKIVLEGN